MWSGCRIHSFYLFIYFFSSAGCTITFRWLANSHQDATILCSRWTTYRKMARNITTKTKTPDRFYSINGGGGFYFYWKCFRWYKGFRLWCFDIIKCVCFFCFRFRMESSPCGRTGAINVVEDGWLHSLNSRDTRSSTAFGWKRSEIHTHFICTKKFRKHWLMLSDSDLEHGS